jgi:hypothetical protein
MLARVLDSSPAEFGIVLIERGQEVGGGERRFSIGTVARITQLEAPESYLGLVVQGERRIEVTEWMPENPHPLATVRELPDLEWDDSLLPRREQAERLVRRTLSLASEFADQEWSPDVALSHDPTAAAWQLAAIAPVGPIDQIALLRSDSMAALLDNIIELTEAAAESLAW